MFDKKVKKKKMPKVEDEMVPVKKKKVVEEKYGVNELYFRVGDMVKVEGIPVKMKVKEVRGVDITLKRMDIK